MDSYIAKQIADKSEFSIKKYLDGIENAAKEGLYVTEFDMSRETFVTVQSIQHRLRLLGFRCVFRARLMYVSWMSVDDE